MASLAVRVFALALIIQEMTSFPLRRPKRRLLSLSDVFGVLFQKKSNKHRAHEPPIDDVKTNLDAPEKFERKNCWLNTMGLFYVC